MSLLQRLQSDDGKEGVLVLCDQCQCGHTRGEHFTPLGGWTHRCLMQGCPCTTFRSATPTENPPARPTMRVT